ncbi:hypothetical protein JKF63_04979 [Porcisia hertigi]|uniref:Uncharacterized protein n=1 Tax=Porcisia hertigi TaxID=2761500 RepID=A0A836IA25_9TRYP|nr:hypothetical protein JKF63_04979 [Porcisia hertigi]
MNSTVIPATLEVRNLYDECGKQANHRHKIMHEYDVYRSEVAKKELEYQRKFNDLSTSRSYSVTLAKRNKLQANFEAANRQFEDTHDYLMYTRGVTCTKAFNVFVDCTSRFLKQMSMESVRMRVLSENALHRWCTMERMRNTKANTARSHPPPLTAVHYFCGRVLLSA